jgi:hypothetical protein
MDQYNRGDIGDTVRDDLLLYYLNSSEVDQVERIGLLPPYCSGFELSNEGSDQPVQEQAECAS